MYNNISILGSTGSIGTQALSVAKNLGITVVALSANSNIDLLFEQIQEFKPKLVAVGNEIIANELYKKFTKEMKSIEICHGMDGLIKVAEFPEAQMLLSSIVGSAGLIPTLRAIDKGKAIALANKETLVTAGKIVMEKAKEKNVPIIPVDSEHSAIFQCLMGNNIDEIEKIILTASGGPFRGKKQDYLKDVTVEQALKHPNWTMGSKITIDSATLMNKGLEVIEASFLFDAKFDIIDVVVHPQSIIHSMVQYCDGSIIAQLGTPDMRIPIQFAFSHPQRARSNSEKLDLIKVGTMTFEQPDLDTFRCLKLAYEALKEGGTMPSVLNAANEIAVEYFLKRQIGFMEIPYIIERQMLIHNKICSPTIEEIILADTNTRQLVKKELEARC